MTKEEYDALPDGACLWHMAWVSVPGLPGMGNLVPLMDRKGRFDASKVDLRWYSVAEEPECEAFAPDGEGGGRNGA